MNRRSDMMRIAALWISVAFLVMAAFAMMCGDASYAAAFIATSCVFLLWAIIIKLEWL